MPESTRAIVVIPTYNEADNLNWLLDRFLASNPDVDVLIVDDGSPDGTGKLADERAKTEPRIQVMHRTVKEGLGAAYLAGFAWALEQGYDIIGEMDADGSHQPEQLPALLDAVKADADLVIGSRYVRGGSVVNWPLSRRLLSVFGNLYIRILLGVRVRDMTAGFRLFKRSTLVAIDLSTVESTGYVFQADLAYRTLRHGLTVREVPIEFIERERGQSKMTTDVASESLKRITQWGLAERRQRLRSLFRRG